MANTYQILRLNSDGSIKSAVASEQVANSAEEAFLALAESPVDGPLIKDLSYWGGCGAFLVINERNRFDGGIFRYKPPSEPKGSVERVKLVLDGG